MSKIYPFQPEEARRPKSLGSTTLGNFKLGELHAGVHGGWRSHAMYYDVLIYGRT